jgi:hypothetical protein
VGGAETEEAGSSSKSKPKSNSASSSGTSAGEIGPPAGVAVPPNRSRNGESMSIVLSTGVPPLPRGRTGCGAWKTPTAPWPGLVTNSLSKALRSSGRSAG